MSPRVRKMKEENVRRRKFLQRSKQNTRISFSRIDNIYAHEKSVTNTFCLSYIYQPTKHTEATGLRNVILSNFG